MLHLEMSLCGWCLFIILLDIVSIIGWICMFFFFQAEDGIRYLVRSRGLGDVYKRQIRIRGQFFEFLSLEFFRTLK